MDRFTHHIYCIFLACALSVGLSESVASVKGCEFAAAGVSVPVCGGVSGFSLLPEIPARAGLSPRLAALSTQLIVRWEVGSPARYTRLYQGVIWPGGASGPTWGIGYDGGHQSPAAIERDWSAHPLRHDLAKTAGVTGKQAQLSIARWRGITTPFSYAKVVFADRSLPSYAQQASRSLGNDFNELPEPTQAALISLGYNRGWSMLGSRNLEKRVIKNVCVPKRDVHCVALQIRAMCRLWVSARLGPGLCSRRNDEARVAVQI